MNDDITGTDQARYGRTYLATARGDTLDELEMNALDQARGIFGPDARLELNRNYVVHDKAGPGRPGLWAMILFREIPDPGGS
jgi:hypothetical protein